MEKFLKEKYKVNFLLNIYERCFDSKHHYDTLSWTIGGVLLAFVSALLIYLLQTEPIFVLHQWTIIESIIFVFALEKILIVFFAWMLIILWWFIYERNRFWPEVANEKIREIERSFEQEGLGVAFSKANAQGFVELKNLDERGKHIKNKLKKDVEPRKEKLIKKSLHKTIRWFLIVISVIILLAGILSTKKVDRASSDCSQKVSNAKFTFF